MLSVLAVYLTLRLLCVHISNNNNNNNNYYYYYYYYYLSPVCRGRTTMYLKQTMFVRYTVLQLFCIYNLSYVRCFVPLTYYYYYYYYYCCCYYYFFTDCRPCSYDEMIRLYCTSDFGKFSVCFSHTSSRRPLLVCLSVWSFGPHLCLNTQNT